MKRSDVKKDVQGQMFTLDLLLALIPLTLVIGYSLGAMSEMAYNIDNYATRMSIEQKAENVIDQLVKNPGWYRDGIDYGTNWQLHCAPEVDINPGLSKFIFIKGETVPNYLYDRKLDALENSHLRKLIGNSTKYFRLTIQDVEPELNFNMTWVIGSKQDVKDVAIAQRTAALDIEALLGTVYNISHGGSVVSNEVCPFQGGGVGKPPIYEVSFWVEVGDIITYDFWIVADTPYGGVTSWFINTTTQKSCDELDGMTKHKITVAGDVGRTRIQIDDYLVEGFTNYIYFRIAADPNRDADFYVIRARSGTPSQAIGPEFINPHPVRVIVVIGR